MSESRSLVASIDRFVFIKKGYSFWKHLIPFSVAALLLVIMSLPEDNLLIKLAGVLEEPSWIWIPAGLLTMVASSVYFLSIHIQIQQAYLWRDGVIRRSILTAFLYLFLCAMMAYGVLYSAKLSSFTWGNIWACFLLATLSLTGIGWSGPDSWVETIGIKIPDYSKAHSYSESLIFLIAQICQKPYGEKQDIVDFLSLAENLLAEISENFIIEPVWTRSDLEFVVKDFQVLIEQTKENFPLENKLAVERFSSACESKMATLYPNFVTAFMNVNLYLENWKKPDRRMS